MKAFGSQKGANQREALCCAITFLASGLACAQAAVALATPANAWMRIATDLGSADNVSSAVRQRRDSFVDAYPLASREPLTPESAPLHHEFPGRFSTRDSEIRDVPNRAVLIATFSEYRSVLTASGHEIYTEAKFRVGNVFQDTAGHAVPHSDITILVRGGTVNTNDGKTISYLTDPRKFSIQPQRTYLLVLGYHIDGDFYKIDRSWDVSDGMVRVNSEVEQKRVQEGRSTLVGLTTEQLIRSLGERFPGK